MAKEYTGEYRKERRCNRLIFEVSNLSRYKRRIIYDLCCISDSRFYNQSRLLMQSDFPSRAAGALYARGKKARESCIVYRPISIDALKKSCAHSWNFRPRPWKRNCSFLFPIARFFLAITWASDQVRITMDQDDKIYIFLKLPPQLLRLFCTWSVSRDLQMTSVV